MLINPRRDALVEILLPVPGALHELALTIKRCLSGLDACSATMLPLDCPSMHVVRITCSRVWSSLSAILTSSDFSVPNPTPLGGLYQPSALPVSFSKEILRWRMFPLSSRCPLSTLPLAAFTFSPFWVPRPRCSLLHPVKDSHCSFTVAKEAHPRCMTPTAARLTPPCTPSSWSFRGSCGPGSFGVSGAC